MDNWKDYVGFQPVGKVSDPVCGCMAFYMHMDKDIGNDLSFRISRVVVPLDKHIHNDDSIGYVVELMLNRFAHEVDIRLNYDHLTLWDHVQRIWWEWKNFKRKGNPVPNPHFHRAAFDVAIKTRRGVANTNFKDIWYYRGASSFDCPIVVTEMNGKYAITTPHENFQDYGFRVIK